eukprot:CAMPEP_0119281244 /NCGR_PEP_ID=MMETSP1329-20130426/24358_1 /TAXON_ID=114041 /ORGANISM="Genus nov. species nov., Strain RCC1024" /LENGTH=161 /DNA_ID=CAMNT_0007281853 /DNA_START=169 /DNA_END=650 /DNA_ORIENTATION=-
MLDFLQPAAVAALLFASIYVLARARQRRLQALRVAAAADMKAKQDAFEAKAAARARAQREAKAREASSAWLAERGGQLVGTVGPDSVEMDGFGGRRGAFFARDYALCGVWVSATAPLAAVESACLDSLLGSSADLEYLATEPNFEGAVLLLAQNGADGAQG